ncbi:MAG: putative type restriction endonuclease [Pyrinomonadaceae bacterium]|nr:putative type restriction endonuclease [Pyrinomonadaceae bacterium]
MDFIDELKALAGKVPALCDVLQTEQATKNALVMPFIRILGYDIFDPMEVVPEFIADVGIKKGEKVDYAIKKDDKIIMLFECKHCGGDLNIKHASQLFRYFAVTDARVGVLTNGVQYRFFTDLEAPNKMDDKPFLEVNMLDLNDSVVAELKKLSKPAFNIDALMTAAGELKYMRAIKKLLAEQMENPSDEFVKFCASKVYEGTLTPSRREYFHGLTKRGFSQLVTERINERLKTALTGDPSVNSGEVETEGEALIETTAEELEGFYLIKSLLRDVVDPSRIIHRDTQSYMGILLDDNNRKPIARLYFNRPRKYLGVFDENRKEERVHIESLNDIFKHADRIRRVFAFYEREKAEIKIEEETETNT